MELTKRRELAGSLHERVDSLHDERVDNALMACMNALTGGMNA